MTTERETQQAELEKTIGVNMQEFEEGYADKNLIRNRLNEYIGKYEANLFIVNQVSRYNIEKQRRGLK